MPSLELSLLDLAGLQLMDLHKTLLTLLIVEVPLLLLEHHYDLALGVDELQRDSFGEEPKGFDLVHPVRIVYLYPCVFITHCDVRVAIDMEIGKESRDAEVGVEILALAL